MKYLTIYILSLFLVHIAEAFDPSKLLGTSKEVANPNVVTKEDRDQIDNLIKSFESLDLNQKEKVIEFRQACKQALENLMLQFETLPKEVKEVLRLEKTTKQSLSSKGKEELEKYLNDK